ncbi:hypothetical protein BDV27DRAFT_160425 [Aspergillus caelatus]|uniref:Uncharacterized protein n=2 Tax=Aspergillus subgen. Circumdati TaxID=2720871 RepID=A0A5N6ZVV1_9EURO|nr:uncharacterized protein BDV27DRAFT_160425 [Aspergillus caelatus]KAE8361734.1 hypothetical protein BDV27DRAFT_160425 [Aspergillus caelatus]KAE8423455.1 hypothetical protein BDV36DRAFT_290137 [Aspergillus pseudocaelatus]
MSSISTRALLPLYATHRNGIFVTRRLPHLITYRESSVSLRSFSTRILLANKQASPSNPDSNEPTKYPAFSFEALGMSKGTKAFVIAILCCFGTMETWFWCKTIWRWWKGKTGEVEPIQATK